VKVGRARCTTDRVGTDNALNFTATLLFKDCWSWKVGIGAEKSGGSLYFRLLPVVHHCAIITGESGIHFWHHLTHDISDGRQKAGGDGQQSSASAGV
jgi:hypothetical protein